MGAPLIVLDNYYGQCSLHGGENFHAGLIKVTNGTSEFFPTVRIENAKFKLGTDLSTIREYFTTDSRGHVQVIVEGNAEAHNFDAAGTGNEPANGGRTYPAFTGIIDIDGAGQDEFTLVSGGATDSGTVIFGSCNNGGLLADNATYYAGGLAVQGWNATYDNIRGIRMPRAGRIRGVAYTMYNNTGASAETSTLYLNINDTVHEPIDTAVVNNALETGANKKDLWIAVNAGDVVTFEWRTPAWTTPPPNSFFNYSIDFLPTE